MIAVLAGISFAINYMSQPAPVAVQFTHGAIGRNVTVCIDGQQVETSFAGKLTFHDNNRSWMSVCADVRSSITDGQIFAVRLMRTDKMSPNYRKAGAIVARYFDEACTPTQCAGLQLAVWKAAEDNADLPDFSIGHFQARAEPAVLQYANYYYQAAGGGGAAIFLAAGGGGGAGGGGATGGAGGGGGGQSQLSSY